MAGAFAAPAWEKMECVPAAELFALLMFLQHAASFNNMYTFFGDCAFVIDGIKKGRHAMCNGWAVHAYLWLKVFDKIEDIGHMYFQAFKVSAHRKVASAVDQHEMDMLIFMPKGVSNSILGRSRKENESFRFYHSM